MPDLPEKEILNQLFGESEEKYPVVDAEPSPKITKEVEGYIEKVEKEAEFPETITDDYGQPLVSPASPQQPVIVLPITKDQYSFGLKQKITQSIRWLAVWAGRLLKIFGTRLVFRNVEK